MQLFSKKLTKCYTIHRHFIDLCAVVLFNIPQNPDVIRFYEIYCHTFASKPTRSTNSAIKNLKLDNGNNERSIHWQYENQIPNFSLEIYEELFSY